VRAHRKRFTTSRARRSDIRDRAIKVREGVAAYRNSMAGRAVKAEQLAEQWKAQNHLCADCGGGMELGDCKFKDRKWDKGATNVVIHKRACTRSGTGAGGDYGYA